MEKDKEKINEARLTKSFMDDCLEVARKLKKTGGGGMMIYDITKRGMHTVKITLQFQDFIGHIITQIGGNCHGKTVLDFDFEYGDEFDTDFVKNDCNLKYDEEYDSFNLTLKNNKGEALGMEATSDELNNMIVGLEIVGFVPESEADNE